MTKQNPTMAIPVLDAGNQLYGRAYKKVSLSEQMTQGVPLRAVKCAIPITR